jgi:cysteine desulfuration protein SufE
MPLATIESKKAAYLAELELLPDSTERFTWLVDFGRRLPALPESLKGPEFKVEGCMSQLWLVPEMRAGLCAFRADSDSAIVKGLAGLLCELYSDATPAAVLAVEPDFLAEVGILQHLSGNRRNGLGRIRDRIKRFAAAAGTAPPG